MKPRTVRLVDIGLDHRFDASMSFVQATLRNINAGRAASRSVVQGKDAPGPELDDPFVEIEFVRSRDLSTVGMAFTAPAAVLHVMAHGGTADGPTFESDDGRTALTLDQLAENVVEYGRGVRTATVFADGCRTASKAWQEALTHCLHGPIAYIGTTANIGWHESTVFSAMFYGVLFRNKGARVPPAEASLHAANAAAKAYTDLLGKNCPYKVVMLEPSRRARGNLSVSW